MAVIAWFSLGPRRPNLHPVTAKTGVSKIVSIAGSVAAARQESTSSLLLVAG